MVIDGLIIYIISEYISTYYNGIFRMNLKVVSWLKRILINLIWNRRNEQGVSNGKIPIGICLHSHHSIELTTGTWRSDPRGCSVFILCPVVATESGRERETEPPSSFPLKVALTSSFQLKTQIPSRHCYYSIPPFPVPSSTHIQKDTTLHTNSTSADFNARGGTCRIIFCHFTLPAPLFRPPESGIN